MQNFNAMTIFAMQQAEPRLEMAPLPMAITPLRKQGMLHWSTCRQWWRSSTPISTRRTAARASLIPHIVQVIKHALQVVAVCVSVAAGVIRSRSEVHWQGTLLLHRMQ